MLYFAFVQPNINYGLIVWGSAMPSALKPIQTNIKKQGKCYLRRQTTLQWNLYVESSKWQGTSNNKKTTSQSEKGIMATIMQNSTFH